MNITVVGCGKIGRAIIENLVAEGHNITAVDNNSFVVEKIVDTYDCIGICGSGTDCDTLAESGVENCRLFIAVTSSDEFNMLSCFMAKRMGARHTIARIRNPEYNDNNLEFMRQQLGISMAINPELLAAKEAFNMLKLPSAIKVDTFSRGNFEIVELKIKEDSPLDGMSLIDVRKNYKAQFLVCAVRRQEEAFIPDGNFVLKKGDRIGITASPDEIVKLLKMLGIMQKRTKSVMISGASRTAYYLAKMLIQSGNPVKIIDRDEERCTEFCEELSQAVIIHGNATKQDLLIEEGIRNVDAFAALTGSDEENVLLSLYAASQKVPKVVSKINRDEFVHLADNIGIDSTISTRRIISDVLVRYARGLRNSAGNKMETLYKIMEGKAEALEFKIQEDCPLIDKSLKDIFLKKNILVAGILRGRKTIIPSGDDFISAGDTVIVLAAGHRINDISDIVK